MHDHGIPARADWPPGVIDAVAAFRQGDVVANLPLFYWGSPATPVHARTCAYADHGVDDDGVIEFGQVAPYGLITTQTCDLAQEGDAKPSSAWVHLAPVFNAEAPHPVIDGKRLLDGGVRKLIRDGRLQHRLWVPDIDEDGLWFADLTFEVPVERGWLARQDRLEGFADESAREEVGRRLAWLRSRPAFDARFVRAVQDPTSRALRELRKADPAAYDRMHEQVAELGVTLTGRLLVGQAELVVLHNGLDDDLASWWHDLWDELHANADGEGFNLLPLRVVDLGDITARTTAASRACRWRLCPRSRPGTATTRRGSPDTLDVQPDGETACRRRCPACRPAPGTTCPEVWWQARGTRTATVFSDVRDGSNAMAIEPEHDDYRRLIVEVQDATTIVNPDQHDDAKQPHP